VLGFRTRCTRGPPIRRHVVPSGVCGARPAGARGRHPPQPHRQRQAAPRRPPGRQKVARAAAGAVLHAQGRGRRRDGTQRPPFTARTTSSVLTALEGGRGAGSALAQEPAAAAETVAKYDRRPCTSAGVSPSADGILLRLFRDTVYRDAAAANPPPPPRGGKSRTLPLLVGGTLAGAPLSPPLGGHDVDATLTALSLSPASAPPCQWPPGMSAAPSTPLPLETRTSVTYESAKASLTL